MQNYPSYRRTPLGLWAVVLLMWAVLAPVQAQTTLQGQLVLRPLSNDDIAAYTLPASTQRSGGLSTVGLGQPAYLEAQVSNSIAAKDIAGVDWALTSKPSSSKATLVDDPLGPKVPSFEPADQAAFLVAGRKMIRPDVAGIYKVMATITASNGATLTETTMITAATYVGIQTCARCHGGGPAGTDWSMAQSWSKTSHSTIFKDGINGVASDHYAVSCLGCHTVGYDTDPAAANGGFDDVAKQLNWTFPATMAPGNWDALPDALKNVGNIQCENCHGPGSTHVANGGDPRLISISYASGDCGQCHGAMSHHFKMGEWVNSGHAVTTRDPSGPGREGCVGCHTAGGFIAKMKGQQIVNTDYNAINCQTCHDPHGRTSPDNTAHLVRSVNPVTLADGTVIQNAGAGALCMNCHQSRRNAAQYVATTAGNSHYGPHSGPQADMLAGTNGFTYGLSLPSSAHGDVTEDSCVHCHMQVVDATDAAFTHAGGHTFRASWADTNNAKHDLVKACQGCHGPDITSFDFPLIDYDEDGKIEGVQTEVQHLLDQLSTLLPPAGKPKTSLAIDSTWTQPQLQAAYNWLFVQSDGSRGVHNMAYTVALLKASITNLGHTPGK